jgi:hypothetical protein
VLMLRSLRLRPEIVLHYQALMMRSRGTWVWSISWKILGRGKRKVLEKELPSVPDGAATDHILLFWDWIWASAPISQRLTPLLTFIFQITLRKIFFSKMLYACLVSSRESEHKNTCMSTVFMTSVALSVELGSNYKDSWKDGITRKP